MPVIENLKNFIRHGKQARNHDHHPHSLPTAQQHQHQHQEQEQPPARSGHGGITASGIGAHIGKTYDEELLAKIVADEKKSRERLPEYPGLERWILKEKMGDGAFSNVYRARDSMGEYSEVAIKVVRKFELNAPQRANILKEVQIMRGLNHPNIVSLISFSESQSYYYLILELCPGGELFHQIVRLTYFSEDLSRHIAVQVAEALRYLHEEKGVVHRDIKPENLLFDPIPFIPTKHPKPRGPEDEEKADEGEFIPGVGAGGIGRIKVADFGLSKVVWDKHTMTPCGTVGYTAPEIVKDERYSKSVDMWALGCVLYTLLCGFPPFYDESISVLTEKVAKGQYSFLSPWWDDISKSAQDLVSHLLTVDPEKRYTIQEFMQHPWIRGTNEATTAALDAPPLATPAPKPTENRFPSPMAVEPDFSPDIGAPGATKRMDFRSPGVVSLREVFDVGYAVHRMEEEGKRRKNWKQGYHPGGTLNEEDEAYSEDGPAVAGVERSLRHTNLGDTPKQSARAAQQQARATGGNSRRKHGGAFELSLDDATLLGRRKRQDQPQPVGA